VEEIRFTDTWTTVAVGSPRQAGARGL
jgi:hypothetical protein